MKPATAGFDADNQATIMLSLVTRHGRTTPLGRLTIDKDTRKDNRNRYEYQVLVWLAEALPPDIKVLIVADLLRVNQGENFSPRLSRYTDRGFGGHKLYWVLTEELKFEYLIGFRGNIRLSREAT